VSDLFSDDFCIKEEAVVIEKYSLNSKNKLVL